MSTRSASPLPPKSSPPQGAKILQERLHSLLNLLATTTDLIKAWPESDGDDPSVHVETTTKLISVVLSLVGTLRKVEGVIKSDIALKRSLQDCKVPINLLDLLDHGNGLNPDCFSRGLLREALGQLDGLSRRKLALEMLGAVIQTGLNQRDVDNNINFSNGHSSLTGLQKRKLNSNNEMSKSPGKHRQLQQKPTSDARKPTIKKPRS